MSHSLNLQVSTFITLALLPLCNPLDNDPLRSLEHGSHGLGFRLGKAEESIWNLPEITGSLLKDPYDEDYHTVWSILESAAVWKLPYRYYYN